MNKKIGIKRAFDCGYMPTVTRSKFYEMCLNGVVKYQETEYGKMLLNEEGEVEYLIVHEKVQRVNK